MSNAPKPRTRDTTSDSIGADYLASVVAAAADLSVLVSEDGTVAEVMLNPAQMAHLRLPDWTGRPVTDCLTGESQSKFKAARAALMDGTPPRRPIELNHVLPNGQELPVRYAVMPHPEGGFMMLGRDLSAIAETQAQLVQAQMSLEQGYEARREYDARYRLLMRSVHDPIIFASASDGTISDLNEPAASLLGGTREGLIGQGLAAEFDECDRAEMMERLMDAAGSDGARSLRLTARRSGREVELAAQMFRAAGERSLLCRLTAQADGTETPAGLARDLGVMFERTADAILFTDLRGEILSCNDAFLDLVNAAQAAEVKSQNITSYFGRGRVDLNVIVENARRAGQMRLYATKIMTELGGATPVEISVTYLNDRSEPVLAYLVRDASRSEALRGGQPNGAPDNARSVMELVGSATLKEIVAETTDVVEKMCIETAVNLTRNNRVAAAEMLGLSRQSLYVKLRKYDLLNRNTGTGA